MFLRIKRAQGRRYLLLVENFWQNGRHRQRTVHNFGRYEQIDPKEVDRILASHAGFAFLREKVAKE